jgi:hypothetical protein
MLLIAEGHVDSRELAATPKVWKILCADALWR